MLESAHLLLKPPSIESRLAPSIFEFLYKCGLIVYGYSEHELTLEDGLQIYRPEIPYAANSYFDQWKHVLKALTVKGRCGLITVKYREEELNGITIWRRLNNIKGKKIEEFNPNTIRGKFSPEVPEDSKIAIQHLLHSSCEGLSTDDMAEQLSKVYVVGDSVIHTPDNLYEQKILLATIYKGLIPND